MTEQDAQGTGNPDDETSAGVEDAGATETSGADGSPSDGGATDPTDQSSSDDGGATDAAGTGSADDTASDSGDASSSDGGAGDASSADDTSSDTGGDASQDGGASDAGDAASSDASGDVADTGSADDASGADTSGADTSGADATTSDPTAADSDTGDGGTSTAGTTGPGSSAAGATTGGSADPGQPYLFVDLYSGDDGRLVGGHPAWTQLAATKGFVGAILKAWDGVHFNDGGWFGRNWPALRTAGGARYGTSWFRGAYLFLEFLQDGATQADAYLRAVDAAGGWDAGDLLPIIDAEQGGVAKPAVAATATTPAKPARPAHPNRSATAQQVVDCVTACAERLRAQTGRRVILYGRNVMDELHIKSRMGCDLIWNPSWTPHPFRNGIEAWTLEEMVLWQYCGDGTAAAANLPHAVAGFGSTVDLSVFTKGSQVPNLQMLKDNLLR